MQPISNILITLHLRTTSVTIVDPLVQQAKVQSREIEIWRPGVEVERLGAIFFLTEKREERAKPKNIEKRYNKGASQGAAGATVPF